jgi:hypothetical protein
MLALTNTSGVALNSLNISFDVTQFWQAVGGSQTMSFGYSYNAATKINAYTEAPAFTFTTPTATSTSAINMPNSVSNVLSLATPWANNSTIYLEWYLPADAVSGIELGIQDISVTSAVPEPSTYALMGVALLLAAWRRLRPARS